jgi:signal peptidase II
MYDPSRDSGPRAAPEPDPAVNEKPSRRLLIAVGVLAAILDLVTKWWVFEAIQEFSGGRPVIDGLLSLQPVRNSAGPWSLGLGWEFLRFALPAVSVLAVVVIGRIFLNTDPRDRMKGLGLALILGGALGNLWDRVHAMLDPASVGVRDFILVHGVWFHAGDRAWRFWEWTWGRNFPAFNLADTWITVGVVLVAWRILFEMRSDAAAGARPAAGAGATGAGADPAAGSGAGPAESREVRA